MTCFASVSCSIRSRSQNVTDDVNYLSSTGRIQGARVRMEASIVEAQTQAEAAERKAETMAQSEVAKLDADLAIARQETDRRIKDALSKRQAMIEEARGAVLAQTAQVKAEITRQTARALQVERKLEADVVKPEDASRRSAEEAARGAAAKIIQTGKAEAEALRLLVAEYAKAGGKAREVLVLQQLMPLVGDIAGAGKGVTIKQLSLLPAHSDGAASATAAISFLEQIRAATGVDLARLVRAAGSDAVAPSPPVTAPPVSPPPLPPKGSRAS